MALEPDLLAQPARLVAPLQNDVAALVVVAPRALVAQYLGCTCGGDVGVKRRKAVVSRGSGFGLRASELGVRVKVSGVGCLVTGGASGWRSAAEHLIRSGDAAESILRAARLIGVRGERDLAIGSLHLFRRRVVRHPDARVVVRVAGLSAWE